MIQSYSVKKIDIVNVQMRDLFQKTFKMDNFYEALDDIFDNITADEKCWRETDLLELKSKILSAYQETSDNRGKYLAKLLKPKSFRILEDGSIVRVD